MLRRLPAKQLIRWKVYFELEPFGETRQDYRIASIAQALYNINRDHKKHKDPFPLTDFVLTFGEPEVTKKPRKTWQEMKMLAKAFAAAHQ